MPATRRQNAEEEASKRRQTRASIGKSPSQATVRRSTPKIKENSKNASSIKSKDEIEPKAQILSSALDVSTKKKVKLDDRGEEILALRGVKRLSEKEESLSEVEYKKRKNDVKTTQASTESDITIAKGGKQTKGDTETACALANSDSIADKETSKEDHETKGDEETTHAETESDSTAAKGDKKTKGDTETACALANSDSIADKETSKEDHETNAPPWRIVKIKNMKTGHDESVPEIADTERSKKSDDGASTESQATSDRPDVLSIPKEGQGSVNIEQSGNSLTDVKAMSTPEKGLKSRRKSEPGNVKRDVAEPVAFTPRKSSRQSVPNRRYLEDVGEVTSTPDKVKKSGRKHIPMETGKLMDPAQKTIPIDMKTGVDQDKIRTHERAASNEGSTKVLISPESPIKSPTTVVNIVRSSGNSVQINKSDSISLIKKLGCVVQVITGKSEQTSPRKIPVDILQIVKQTMSASIGLPPRESDLPLVASVDTTTHQHGKIVHVVKPDNNTPSKTVPVMKVSAASTSPTKKVTLSPGRIIIEMNKTSEMLPAGTTSLPRMPPKETDISKHRETVNPLSTNVNATVSDLSDGKALDHSYGPSEVEITKLPHDEETKVDLLSVLSSSPSDSKTRKQEDMEGSPEDTSMERNEEDIAMERNQASAAESSNAANPDDAYTDVAAHSKSKSMDRHCSVEDISQDAKTASEVNGSDEEDIFQLCEVTGKLKSSLHGTFIEVEEPVSLDMNIQSMDTPEKEESSMDTPAKDEISIDTPDKKELTLDTPCKELSTLDTPGKVIPFIMKKRSASPISQIISTDVRQSTTLSTACPHSDSKTIPVKIKVVTVRSTGNKATASTQTLINLKTKSKKHTEKQIITMSMIKQEKNTHAGSGGPIVQEVIVVNLPEGSTLVDPRPQPDPELADDKRQLMIDADGLYKCMLCSYTTDRKPNWYKHKKKHLGLRPYGCDQCSYSATTSSNLKRHIEAHSDKRVYMCNVCNLMFKQKIHLQRHLKYRHEKKSVKCPLCNYICAHENPDLKIHLRRKHMSEHGGKEFECKVCSAVNYSKKDLRQHMKLHTTGPEMKLFCQYCSFVSDCNSRLQRHMMTHTQEKPFQCGLCDYRGAQKEHVLRHMKAQHNIDVERNGKGRKHPEDAEDNSNASASSVEKEKPNKSDFSSTDKIFACNHCNMKFSKLINLYKHLTQQHLDVMPDSGTGEFPCVVCDFRAPTKKNLLVHMRKHNSQDHTAPSHVFSCVLCQYTNPKRRNLFLHMRKKHHIEIVMKDDGSANCVVSDKMQMSLIKQCGLNPISTGDDDEGLTTLTDEEGQLHIVTNDEEVQSGPIAVETLPYTVLEHEASSMDTSIVVQGTSYINPLADHEAAEAIEGLQALSEQSFTDNQAAMSGNFMQSLLYSQKPAEVVNLDTMVVEVEDVSSVAQIETSQEVITMERQANVQLNMSHGLNLENNVEIPGSQSIQLTEEQLSQLSTGDFVEIDGEMYKVEVANDGNEDVDQAVTITSAL